MISLDPSNLTTAARYHLMIGGIIPRPIAFVTTCNLKGEVNAAPFSYFMPVSSNPMTLAFSIARKVQPDGSITEKDTLKNLRETGEFVVNSAHEWMAKELHQTSADYPYGTNELEQVGLSFVPSTHVAPPRVTTSALHWECRVVSLTEVGAGDSGSSTLVLGQVLQVHVAKSAWINNRLDNSQWSPLSRLGGNEYGTVGRRFELERLPVGINPTLINR